MPESDPLSEKYAHSREEDGCLKNYVILYRDRKVAASKGDPMIKVIQAYSENEATREASRFIDGGFEILAIRFNGDVEYPAHESEFSYPSANPTAEPDEENMTIGEIMRHRAKNR